LVLTIWFLVHEITRKIGKGLDSRGSRRLVDRYGKVINIDEEVDRRKLEVGNKLGHRHRPLLERATNLKKKIFDNLEKGIGRSLKGSLDMTSLAYNNPTFFISVTPKTFKKRKSLKLLKNRKRQLRENRAHSLFTTVGQLMETRPKVRKMGNHT